MPCNCDYMEPTTLEIVHSKIVALLNEITTGELSNYPKELVSYNPLPNSYSREYKKTVDKDTERLCTILSSKNNDEIKNYSLEMQIWWRDHQKADKEREIREKNERESLEIENEIRQRVIEERKLRGLN